MKPDQCVWCGSAEFEQDLAEQWRCRVCDLTPEASEAKVEEAVRESEAKLNTYERQERRKAELRRRADLVISSTRGLDMRVRIGAAMLLLQDCHGLTAPTWDRRYEAWKRNPPAARRVPA